MSGRLEHFTDAKVTNFDRLAACEEDILSFDISMDHFATVHILKRHANLNKPLEDFLFAELFIRSYLLLNVEREIANCSTTESA